MNERLKELMIQADYPAPELALRAHRLAELIVQECYEHCKGQLLNSTLANEHNLSYNDGVADCAIGLLQHFGVSDES